MIEAFTEDEQMINVIIRFQGEPDERTLSLREKEDIYTLLNYERIRKKILQAYKYKLTGKDSVQLAIQNFYRGGKLSIPVLHPSNYTFLVNDMIQRGLASIIISVKKTGELTKKKQRQKMIPIQFDSDGSIEQAEGVGASEFVIANRPKEQPYRGNAVVRCLFCHKSSRDAEDKRVAGPFYGPFLNKSYAHHLCLIWCSHVYINEQLELKGVEKATKVKIECSYCRQRGASFYCHAKACRKGGHYKCALENDWYFNWSKYQTYCPECISVEDINIGESQSRPKNIPQIPTEPQVKVCSMDEQPKQ